MSLVKVQALYDTVNYKPEEALTAERSDMQLRRLTESISKGQTAEIPQSEYERLSELDPPAVAKVGSDEAEAGLQPNSAATMVTKPGGGPTDEPTDPSESATEDRPVTRDAVIASMRTVAAALRDGVVSEEDLEQINERLVDEYAAAPAAEDDSVQDSTGSSLSPEAQALYDAGTVNTLTGLAEKKGESWSGKVSVESGDKKADLARKLADAGARSSDLPSEK